MCHRAGCWGTNFASMVVRLTPLKYSIFGEASVVTSLTNPASGHALNGNVGLRVRW